MSESYKAPEIVLVKSEIEAAAARVAERAMNSTVDGLGGFVADVFGGAIGDAVKQWRNRNLVESLAKTKSLLEDKGIPLANAKALPMGEMYAIFEGMSKQDDPQLTEMWAALLATAMSPGGTPLDPVFSKILEQLSGADAVVLNFYYEANAIRTSVTDEDKESKTSALEVYRRFVEREGENIARKFGTAIISSSISNLIRLTLLTVESSFDGSNELIELSGGRYGPQVEYPGLKDELSHIYYRLNLATSPADDHLLTQHYPDRDRKVYFLPYDLTKLASRLLSACSPNGH